MPIFVATAAKGLQSVVEQELGELGFKKLEKHSHGVAFESNWEGCYRANLCLRTASRVLLPILDFPAYQNEDLYNNILKHDFTKYIPANGTLSVDAVVQECPNFRDQRFVAMKVKDAIVDQFRDKFGVRPDVDSRDPDMSIVVRGFKNMFHVSIDTSGAPLYKRGYRKVDVAAPLKEHLAAGLLKLAGYDGSYSVVDPMCGSGTFLIESLLMALNIAPGTLRRNFGFQRLSGFQADAWQNVVKEVMEQEKTELPFSCYGFDKNGDAVRATQKNAEAAGVSDYLIVKRQSVELLEPPTERGLVVVNPPYGERLVDENLKDVYRDLAFSLKHRFKGWSCWVLSGDPVLSSELKLKTSQKIPFMNGPIECRWLKYDMF